MKGSVLWKAWLQPPVQRQAEGPKLPARDEGGILLGLKEEPGVLGRCGRIPVRFGKETRGC